jgi:hypothetical protein
MAVTIQSELFVEDGNTYRRIIHNVPDNVTSSSVWIDHRSKQESDDPFQGHTGTLGQTVIWINHVEVDNNIRLEDGIYQYRFDKNFGLEFSGKTVEIKALAENARMVLENFEMYLILD